MSRVIAMVVVVNLVVTCVHVAAAIPEPDVVLYGTVLRAGQSVRQQDAVVVLARLGSGQEIGRYDFGDCNADGVRDVCERSCSNPGCTGVTGCGTARDTSPADGLLDDCPGNLYALRVRTESVPQGLTATGQAAVLNLASPTSVQILIQVGGGAEQPIRQLWIDERGEIRNITLSVLDLFAFRNFSRCYNGPQGASPGGLCDAALFSGADYDDDGDVDLRDYAFIQSHFGGN